MLALSLFIIGFSSDDATVIALLWAVAAVVVLAVLMWIIAGLAAHRGQDDEIQALGNILPAAVVLGSTVLLVLLPASGIISSTSLALPLWLHRFGLCLLFTFLIVGQYLQIEAWIKVRRGYDAKSIAITCRRLKYLTELMPAPAALMILLSGLKLIYQGGYSVSSGWVFYLVSFFSLMFIDGLVHYRPHARKLMDVSARAEHTPDKIGELTTALSDWFSRIRLFLHFASFPFLFLLGYFKPTLTNPLAGPILWLESRVSSIMTLAPFTGVIGAVSLVLVVIGTVLLLENGHKKWKARSPKRFLPKVPF